MDRRSFPTLILAALTAAAALAADASTDDQTALQGAWTATSGEVAGQQVTDDALKVFRIVVKDNTITFAGDIKSTFVLDARQSPKVIAVTPRQGPRKGKTQRAIYSLENNTLRLCMRDPSRDNTEPPQDFATQPGDGVVLITFQRDASPAERR